MGLIFETILLDFCLLVTVLLIAIIFHYIHAFGYWKRRNVPFISPSFPWGSVPLLAEEKQNFGYCIAQMYQRARIMKQRFIGFYVITKPLIVITDPDLIKSIIVKDFNYFQGRGVYFDEEKDPLSVHLVNLTGPKWKRIRKKVTPTFTSGKMKTMFYILVECSNELQTVIQKLVDNNEPIDTRDIFEKLTINNIGSCVFGLDCNCFKDKDNEFQKNGIEFFESTMSDAAKILFAMRFPSLLRLFRVRMIKKEISDFFINLFRDVVEDREKTKVERKDFIDLFIKLKNNKNIDELINEDEIGKDDDKLTFNELVAQAFVFFAAGFETSATTINYCLFELAQYPDIQEKLRQEIQMVLDKHDGALSYDVVSEMTYLDQVVNETLRKYPPIPFLNRKCEEDYKISDSDVILEKGNTAWISVLGLHNDPEYYPEPEVFNPERFTKENVAVRHPFTYLPFGEGPRNCIGLRFGLLQVKVAVITLIKSFKYTVDPSLKLPIKFNTKGIFISPKERILLRARKI